MDSWPCAQGGDHMSRFCGAHENTFLPVWAKHLVKSKTTIDQMRISIKFSCFVIVGFPACVVGFSQGECFEVRKAGVEVTKLD